MRSKINTDNIAATIRANLKETIERAMSEDETWQAIEAMILEDLDKNAEIDLEFDAQGAAIILAIGPAYSLIVRKPARVCFHEDDRDLDGVREQHAGTVAFMRELIDYQGELEREIARLEREPAGAGGSRIFIGADLGSNGGNGGDGAIGISTSGSAGDDERELN